MTATLAGVRVLVPRSGGLGERLAGRVRQFGGDAVIAPVIGFRAPDDVRPLSAALARLASGFYDWLAVTSATTVDVLAERAAHVPASTRVAAVGPATADALAVAGYRVDFVPQAEFSASGMLAEWPGASGAALLPHSAIAEPTLEQGLRAAGMQVDAVAAYQTVDVPWSHELRDEVGAGGFDALLLTSASMGRAIAAQCTVDSRTVVACIGESTAAGARRAGLAVHVIASSSTADRLIDALADHFTRRTHPGS